MLRPRSSPAVKYHNTSCASSLVSPPLLSGLSKTTCTSRTIRPSSTIRLSGCSIIAAAQPELENWKEPRAILKKPIPRASASSSTSLQNDRLRRSTSGSEASSSGRQAGGRVDGSQGERLLDPNYVDNLRLFQEVLTPETYEELQSYLSPAEFEQLQVVLHDMQHIGLDLSGVMASAGRNPDTEPQSREPNTKSNLQPGEVSPPPATAEPSTSGVPNVQERQRLTVDQVMRAQAQLLSSQEQQLGMRQLPADFYSYLRGVFSSVDDAAFQDIMGMLGQEQLLQLEGLYQDVRDFQRVPNDETAKKYAELSRKMGQMELQFRRIEGGQAASTSLPAPSGEGATSAPGAPPPEVSTTVGSSSSSRRLRSTASAARTVATPGQLDTAAAQDGGSAAEPATSAGASQASGRSSKWGASLMRGRGTGGRSSASSSQDSAAGASRQSQDSAGSASRQSSGGSPESAARTAQLRPRRQQVAAGSPSSQVQQQQQQRVQDQAEQQQQPGQEYLPGLSSGAWRAAPRSRGRLFPPKQQLQQQQ
mmetsp:Transcript_19043/g.41054  ORF Transcript_19043/g.41054 Transcript_19043/m.41054 type:complete len:534 (-) Transcript_19043:231-1832(-)|eukprot:CAMPEP_0202898350 /NCGR_PEP_ID=MMETSP1392-20130828/6897_1 /ASSEMBLY_ACC=CAM_ASM_000868 /TAXON_ID=225041 /ORGANISM="Chlamydomonas chlamydogama, Strain SAG 11-48b" /LENGTH=533 /DNA_ID=CAMNT_0049584253 /DNA_START=126 /DNA_END=1727 /DNA_ORIENTATION=+